MPSFDNITIIHLFNYRRERGTVNPIRAFNRACKPFSPMSCMRHVHIIYVDSHDKLSAIEEFVETVKPTCESCEVFTGMNSYEFMLNWGSGILSSKLSGNDHFVLGTIREEWTKLLRNKPPAAKLLSAFMQSIFSDIRAIRAHADTAMKNLYSKRVDRLVGASSPRLVAIDTDKVVERSTESTDIMDISKDHEHVASIIPFLIRNCCQSRSFGFSPIYERLDMEANDYLAMASTAHKKEVKESLRKLQVATAKDYILLPSMLRGSQKYTGMLSKTMLTLSKSLAINNSIAETNAMAGAGRGVEPGSADGGGAEPDRLLDAAGTPSLSRRFLL